MLSTRMRALAGPRALAVVAAAVLAAGSATLGPAAQAATGRVVSPATTCAITVYNPFVNGFQVWGWDYINCTGNR
jgi:hypothetical protein